MIVCNEPSCSNAEKDGWPFHVLSHPDERSDAHFCSLRCLALWATEVQMMVVDISEENINKDGAE